MPTYSKSSADRLSSCHSGLELIFKEVLKTYDHTILQGFRPEEEQTEYFRTGRSKVEWPNSKHNTRPSNAVDVAPYPIDWNNLKRFYHFAGFVQAVADQRGIRLRWGGDWDSDRDLDDQTFMDLVHFEIVGWGIE